MFTNILLNTILPPKCFCCEADSLNNYFCETCENLCNLVNNPLFLDNNDPAAIFFYEFSIKKLIQIAKFEKSLAHAYVLINLAKKALQGSFLLKQIKLFEPQAIVYVPSTYKGLITRGFDISFLFANILSKILNCPIDNLLKKPLNSKKMSSITNKQERLEAIKGSFLLKPSLSNYKKILLLDDVVTTGATFSECSKMLKKYSKQIKCLAIAQTPLK